MLTGVFRLSLSFHGLHSYAIPPEPEKQPHRLTDSVLIVLRPFQLTPDGKRAAAAAAANKLLSAADTINENSNASRNANAAGGGPAKPRAMEEDFFDMLTKSQSKRMDDQRCSLKVIGRSATVDHAPPSVHALRKPLAQQNSIPVSSATAGGGGGGGAKQENR